MSEVERLAAAVGKLADGVSPPRSVLAELGHLCHAARLAFDAKAVSVARVVAGGADGHDGLRYEAADGAGAEQIVGVQLGAGEGIAGFVAASGQALSIDRVADDPRFARQVAESTGYLPAAMLVVPIEGGGDPLGVLSVLDRSPHTGSVDPLVMAGAFARLAAPPLAELDRASRHGAVLLAAMAVALDSGDGVDTVDADAPDAVADALAAALRDEVSAGEWPDPDLARQLALMAELAARPAELRSRAERVIEEMLALTEQRRRR